MTATNVGAILLCIFGLAHGNLFEVKSVDSSSGLYFEETGNVFFYNDEWKIVTNVNLTKYHNELDVVRSTVNGIMTNCEEMKLIEIGKNASIKGSEGCGPALFQLNMLMADIEENDSNWFGKSERVKRNGLTEMVLDDWPNDDFLFFEKFVNMTALESKSSTSADNRTSYMMSTLNSVGELSGSDKGSINDHVANQLAHIHNTLVAASNGSLNAVRLLQLRTAIQDAISYQVPILTTFGSKQKQYLSILSLVGATNVPIRTIISSINLLNELNNIRSIVSENGLGFPIRLTTENMHSLFDLSLPEISLFRDQIFVTFKLPLIRKESGNFFTLIKVTSSLHSLTNNIYTFGVSNHEFIAIDNHKERYVTLTVNDLNNCHRMKNNETSIICKQISPTLSTSTSSECEINLLLKTRRPSSCQSRYILNEAEIFVKILEPNSWLVTMPQRAKIRYMCDGKLIKEVFDQINGILTIGPNCKLLTDNVILIGRNTLSKNSIREHQIGYFATYVELQREKCSSVLSDGGFQLNKVAQVIHFGEMEKLVRISDSEHDVDIKRKLTNFNFFLIVVVPVFIIYTIAFFAILIAKMLANNSVKEESNSSRATQSARTNASNSTRMTPSAPNA